VREKLERVYRMGIWLEDPYTNEGRERFERALDFMRKAVKHPFIENILKLRKIRILELCGGTGIGGIALGKALSEKGVDVDLLITDLRASALEIAKRWSMDVLGKEARVKVLDAKEAYKLNERFDIILIYGLSIAHFSPWDFILVLCSVNDIVDDKGIFIIDQIDIRHSILMRLGYKEFVVERVDEDRAIISIHAGYDIIKGTAKRLYINLINKERVLMDVCYWGLAELASLVWLFFKEVDFIRMLGDRYFILAKGPRRKFTMKELKNSIPREVDLSL